VIALFGVAFAASVQIASELPVNVRLDGIPVANVLVAAKLAIDVEDGEHTLEVDVRGKTRTHEFTVEGNQTARLVVGKSGTAFHVEGEVPVKLSTVRIRGVGSQGLLVQVGDQRFPLGDTELRKLVLAPGRHDFKLMNADGTMMFASGSLRISGAEADVLVSEGRLPEVTGDGAFDAGF